MQVSLKIFFLQDVVSQIFHNLSICLFSIAPSEPRNLSVVKVTSTSAELRWIIPANTNGQIHSYQLYYRPKYSEAQGVSDFVPFQHHIPASRSYNPCLLAILGITAKN